MAKEIVEVDLILNAIQFRNDLIKASQAAAKFNKGLQTNQKAGGKVDKDQQKIAKDLNKTQELAARRLLTTENKLLNIKKQRYKEDQKISKAAAQEQQRQKKEAADARAWAAKNGGLDEDEEQKGGSGIGRALFKGLKGGTARLIGMALGAITQRVTDAGGAAMQLKASGINLAGGGKQITSMDELRPFLTAGGAMAYDPIETATQAAAMARATGEAGDVATGQQFARAGMLDMGQATGFMGLQARGGVSGAAAKRDLERILASAFGKGLDDSLERGRFGEYLEGISSLVEGAQGRAVGEVGGSEYAKSLALLASSGMSGLKGARGASTLGQLEQGYMSGGGAAGTAMALRAGGYGTPGGTTSHYDAMKARQQGFSGVGGAARMQQYLKTLKDSSGGNMQSAVEMANATTGLSYEKLEKIFEAAENPDALKNIEKLMEGTEPLDQQMVDVLKGTLSDQAKLQSDRQLKLVDQGWDMTESLNDIQDSINIMINKLLPVALKSLDIIAKTIEVVAQGVTDAYDYWVGKDDPKKLSPSERDLLNAKEVSKTILRQVSTGIMDKKQGLIALKELRDKNEKMELLGNAFGQGGNNRKAARILQETVEKIEFPGEDPMTKIMADIVERQTAANAKTKEEARAKEKAANDLKNKGGKPEVGMTEGEKTLNTTMEKGLTNVVNVLKPAAKTPNETGAFVPVGRNPP